jgi:hypothetical protein
MMGERRVMQEALFYGFRLSVMSRTITSGARLTASSICRRFRHLEPYYSEVGRRN